MNHLQRKTVEQVNKQDMECKEATAEKKKEGIEAMESRRWSRKWQKDNMLQ